LVTVGDLDGRVALVTGAASGIGRAVAESLAAAGARVTVADIDGDGAASVASEICSAGYTAEAATVDVSAEDDVEALVTTTAERGGALEQPFETTRVEDWDRTFAVNLLGPVLCSRAAVGHMVDRGRGSIINVSSVASLGGDAFAYAYASSKGALNVLTRYLATAYGRLGVRCNAVLPGLTLSPAARALLPPEMVERWAQHTPAPQLAEPADIADVVMFLASDRSRMVNGQLIAVDGGYSAHQPSVAPGPGGDLH
jgi:NAD(P)-dependent dehydrogenase (short-subunit alcohol dehydrogenase family)